VPDTTSELRPEPDLLAAARAGDRDALGLLLEQREAQIYRFSMKMCRDPEDAREVLQDTLLTVARSIREFRGDASMSTWLYAIARSFCIKKRRRSKYAPKKEVPLDGTDGGADADLTDSTGTPEELLDAKRVDRALEQAIGALDPMYREVLVLRDIEGLTAAEVAEVVGISAQAVKSRLHRARAAVREKMLPLVGASIEPPANIGQCPDIAALFSKHVEDEVTAEVCAAMERHLAACPRCRDVCESLGRTLALCRAQQSAEPIPGPVQASVRRALRTVLHGAR